MIKGNQVVNGLCKEGVPLFRKDEVVGNTDRNGLWKNDRVYQERVERPQATNIKVEIYTSVMVQNEVTNHIGALDNVLIVVEGIKKPRIMFCNKLARAGICPQHVLADRRV